MAQPIRLLLRSVATLSFCWVAVAHACQIPVFRYALERWPAEACEVTVFHRGPLAPERQAAVDWLKQAEESIVNIKTELVDLAAKPTDEQRALWTAQGNASLPWMVVRHGRAPAEMPAIFAGPLDGKTVRAVVDSPARREIVRRITSGQSAVWVVVESGDKAKDESVAATLDNELARAEKTLELPDINADKDGPKLLAELPLKIAFSALRVSRSDPAEQVLVSMLLNSEKEMAPGPAIFPVFGRGRVLGALAGEMISPERIAQGTGFIAGPCSCQVKGLNPGFDLLLAADWDGLVSSQPTTMPGFLAPPFWPTPQAAVAATGVPRWILATGIAAVALLLVGYRAWRFRTDVG